MFDTERWAQIERDYADYLTVLHDVQAATNTCGPHCDSLLLHAPGRCWACDLPQNAPLHQARREMRIAYTGEYARDGWRICPSTVLRPVEQAERWGGNTPMTIEEFAARQDAWQKALNDAWDALEKEGKEAEK